MENFTFKIRIKILLSFILSSLFMNVYGGEGTKQTTPDVNHRASLCINNNEYGNFARYGSTNEQRLYIRIQNPNSEKVYLGFSKARRSAPDNSNSEVDSKFRILDPNGNIVFGSYNLTTASSNITGTTEAQKLSRAQNGPNGINGITTTGYVPIVFDPTGMPAGDYYIEFETNNNSYTELYYNYYDITVANNATKNSISGRLYSKRWALAMDNVTTDFNGAFFVFAPDNGSTTGAITQTGFVNKINFNGAGFRPWYFNVAFNNTGAGSTGNTANDQKSVWNATNATKMSPKYEVFLNDPDINVWKNGTYNGNIQINGITNCGIGESNINISVFKSGTIDILLDFNNGDGIYTPGTKDVLTTQSVTGSGAPPYAVSVPWNGKDGLGNTIAQGTSIPIVVSFGQAAFHFPMYDIEENQNGFSCTTVRPAAPSGYVLKLYWDDSNITYTGGVFSSKINLTGCTPNNVPPGNCHTWNNFNSNNNGSPQYGNLNTINTWWYANRDFVTSNITLPPFYTVALGPKTNVTCFGGNDGKIQVNVTNGTAPFTYYINGETTPNTLQALIAGTYNIKVVDANGCSANINGVVITQPTAALALAASSKTDVICYGKSTGSVNAGAISNSIGTVTYNWKNASNVSVGTTASVSNLPAGTYTLTVTDNCSTQTNSVTISQPSAALALAASSKTDVTCFGFSTGSVTAGLVTNSVGTVNYVWKNALNVSVGTTASVSNLPAGTYTLTVTDNCSAQTNSVIIGQPSAALALAASSKTDVTCFGFSTGSVTAGLVTNSVGTVTYNWKNASNVSVGTTASVSNLPAGTYTLTVTDNCSTQTNSVIIGQPSAALALAPSSKTDVTCFGFSTGSVTAGLVTNSVGSVNYNWKNASNVSVGTTASVSNLPAGTYTLTVTDNCSTQTNSVIIGQPSAALALAPSSKTDVTCFGFSTGSVTAGLVTNSVGSVNYNWKNALNVSVGTTASVSNLPAGTYTLTVTDNCSTQTNSVVIGQPIAALALAASSKTDVTCFGFSTGSVTAGAVTNFVGTVTYNWKNASNISVGTTASVSNLPAGTYTLTVTDNCSSQTNSVTISQPSAALALAASSKTDITCFGFSTGSVTAGAVTNNVGTVNYVWKNALNVSVGNTASVTNLPAGTYTLTVTDNCSTQTNSVIIGQPTAALALAASSKTDVTCFGFSTGSVTAGLVTNSVGTVNYVWKNALNVSVGTTASVSNLSAGTYTLTVTDNCSTQTNSVIIGQPTAALALAASSKTDVTCFGFSTGSVTAGLVTNSVGTVTYNWKNAANVSVGTTASISNLPAGTYTLTVTDNCSTQTNSVIIGQPSAALALAASSKTDVTCFGFSTGTVTAGAVTNFVGTVTYNWKNVSNVSVGTTASVSNLPAGTYTLTVTDNCSTQTNSVIIGQPSAALALAPSSKTDVTCFGFSTGSVTTGLVTNSVGSVNYNWKNASNVSVGTTASVSNLPAGTYTLTVTDNCSTQTNSVIIGQPSAALALAASSKTDVTCFGFSTGTVTAGAVTNFVGTVTYNWKNVSNVSVGTTASVSNLPAGTYTLTVTDNCSTQTNSVIIGQPSAALALAPSSKTDVTCFGFSTGSVTAGLVTNSVGSVNYNWKNASNVSVGTTASVSNLPAGTYTLTVTDNCSTQTNSVIIGQPSAALALAASSKTDVTCFGFSTGTVTAGAVTNFVGTVTYNWKNVSNVSVGTTASVSNLPAGTYTLTVTDNCSTQTNSVIIGQPSAALALAPSSKTDVTCFGFSTGSVTAGLVTNSVGSVNYNWKNASNVSVGTTASVSNLPAGTYTLTVTDNCSTQTNSVIIGQPSAALALAPSSKTDVTCFGFSTGSVTAGLVTNSVGSVNYNWKNALNVSVGTTASVSNLPAGTYTLTVTDNCSTQTNTVIIGQPSAALALAASSKTDVTCFGFSTGTVTAGAVTNNVGTVNYVWKNALNVSVGTTASVSNLPAGTYTLTVTDNCSTQTNSVIIGQPSAALALAASSKTDVTCFGFSTGSVTAGAVTNNVGTVNYVWKNASNISVGTTASVSNLPAGNYTLTVTDNCSTQTNSVIIGQPSAALALAASSKTDITCFGFSTGTVTAGSVTNNVGTINYNWKNASNVSLGTTASVSNLPAGTYTLTVTDNCSTQTNSVIIGQPSAALSATTSQINVGCGGGNNGSASVTVSGGTLGYTYSWDTTPVQTSATATGLVAGTYTVTIKDANLCTISKSVTITDGDAVKPIIDPLPLASTINCPALPVFATATATDNNGTISSLTYDDVVTQGTCEGSYITTRTWTAVDACGNISLPVSQVINVQDITAPTWSTVVSSLNKTIECSDTAALTSAQALFPIASDLCDSDVSDIVKVSGAFVASADCSNAGTYTNTWTVKDDCGNTSDTFTQVITIEDTSAPTWSTALASLNKTIECSDATALTSAQALFPIASDLCDSDVSDIVKVSGAFVASADCSNAGTYTNTWTVKDDCGNTSDTFTQVITIQDTTKPTWSTAVASLNKTIECSDTAALTSAQALFPIASDLCDNDVSDIVKVSGAFVASADCSNAGTYTNTWTVKDDCGNTSDTFTQVITIQDTTKPTFIGELPTDITVSCDAVPEPANVEATDNCNGNLPVVFSETKSDIVNGCSTNYTLTRTWTTSDCGLNTASYTQIITVRDTTPPTGTAPVDVANLQTIADIPVGNPGDIKDAVDNCSSTVDITVSDSNNSGSGCDGNAYILTRTYTLTDCAGNKTELKQTFTVENKVSVSGVASNVTCLGGKDGLILVTNTPGSTVVIRNENNEVVGNTNLPAGTYTLTATSSVNSGSETCSATATVVISQPTYTVKISGQIINKDTNTPIANVPVTLVPQGTTTGPILLRITGADGLYNFSGMVAGSYLVQVQDANLNSAHQLYPIDSSLFFTTLEDCKIQEHNFEYGKSTLPVLGDYVWYDTNGNGIQDEWYDANNDGIVTKNIPDGNGAIDYSQWEWIDLNGDGSYTGPSNVGELNAGGFGNALNANVIIDGPNGYHQEVIIGIEGFWRDRPATANPYGDYTIKLVKDANLDAVAANLGASGLVKILPSINDKKVTNKTGKSQLHTVCSTTSGASGYIVTITPEDLVHLNADFGVNCKVFSDIVANDDSAGPIARVNHITPNVLNVLPNDTLEGVVVKASDVIITTVTPNEFLQLNADGSVDVLANAPSGTLTLVYQICEADQTTNCDTATVTITIVDPAPPTPVVANDDVYSNIGCNTFGLVGNVLINDFKGIARASLELVNFTLLNSNNNAKTDPNITFDAFGNVTVSSLTPAGTYTYSYQICDKLSADNCDTATVTITVVPNGITNIASKACNDDSTLIDLLALLPENTPLTGVWIDPNNSNTIQGNTFNALGLALGNYIFEYKITDQNCPRSILLNMEINDDCKVLACGNVVVHNAFSPNGDGINDVFRIDSIDDTTCYPENNVEIYNRWGILVFETDNYNNTTNAFDGISRGRTTVKQSDGLPTGTYFYIINYKSLDGNNVLQNNKKDGYLYLSK